MEIFTQINKWWVSTHLQDQLQDVDAVGLFTNPWFIVPFGSLICYMLYKQCWRDLIIMAIFVGVWWVTGTTYMDTLLVGDIIQIEKILPVVFGGAVALGLVIYLLFGRSD